MPSSSTDAIDLDEIEEVNDFEEVADSALHAAAPKKKRGPTVMLEKPVDEGDAETHFDLGLAYKEMGLHDEAIKAFEKAAHAPGREVSCRMMIGMIYRDQGAMTEAIQQMKQGLHAEPTERERQSLYYELGVTYEMLEDPGEAIYFFEMLLKRDPNFADAGARVANLRAMGGRAQHADDDL
jgi:tetratricopeptide (TPR) repeat protein